jgi:integrase
MTRIRLKYINAFRDRHGRLRYYFRRPGYKSVALHGLPGSAEFMDGYENALAGTIATNPKPIGADRFSTGTVDALTIAYFNSVSFGNLTAGAKRQRRGLLERFAAEHGDKRVALLQRKHIEQMIAAKLNTPSGATNFLVAIRSLMKFAVDTGVIQTNPTVGIERPKIRTDGHLTWSEDDIAAYENKHPVGTQARLALALLLHTVQRVSDVLRLGRQHLRQEKDGSLSILIRQEKTGTSLVLPVLPELKAVLDALPPSDNLTFLTTKSGKPYTTRFFTKRFTKWCREAGLPKGLVAHGLRKAGCRRLIEHGCSRKEVAAWSGHKTLKEVERYTIAASQERLARAAAVKLVGKKVDGSGDDGEPR